MALSPEVTCSEHRAQTPFFFEQQPDQGILRHPIQLQYRPIIGKATKTNYSGRAVLLSLIHI